MFIVSLLLLLFISITLTGIIITTGFRQARVIAQQEAQQNNPIQLRAATLRRNLHLVDSPATARRITREQAVIVDMTPIKTTKKKWQKQTFIFAGLDLPDSPQTPETSVPTSLTQS